MFSTQFRDIFIVMVRRQANGRKELKMRAAVLLAIVAALVPHPALSYIVRHAAVPAPLQGTWAATDEDCEHPDKYIIISDKTYIDGDKSCGVLWVSETAAARGPAYSAHMECSSPAAESKKSIDNVIMLTKDANHLSMGPEFTKLKVVQRCATH
jgi:hypothetical protein